MAKGEQGVLRPATGRQLGRVRKCLDKKKWSARFEFSDSKRVTMDGPTRASRAAAEKDRELIAATMSLQPRSSRVEAASAAIKCLRSGQAPTLQDGPGSASTIHNLGTEELASMGKVQLRKLAHRTPGITHMKRNKKGKWSTKSCKELKEGLLALKNVASAQVLPGCKGNIKAEVPVSDSTKAEMLISDGMGAQSRRTRKRPASMMNAARARKTSTLQG